MVRDPASVRLPFSASVVVPELPERVHTSFAVQAILEAIMVSSAIVLDGVLIDIPALPMVSVREPVCVME